MFRIAIIGPESTGKSTLAKQLSSHFNGKFIPEFAREYLKEIGTNYTKIDVEKMAQGQFDSFMKTDDHLQFIDTELICFSIWYAFKYKETSEIICDLLNKQHIDLFFICSPDLPWEEDPLRENPTDRDELFRLFVHKASDLAIPYYIISGEGESRAKSAIELVNSFLETRKVR